MTIVLFAAAYGDPEDPETDAEADPVIEAEDVADEDLVVPVADAEVANTILEASNTHP